MKILLPICVIIKQKKNRKAKKKYPKHGLSFIHFPSKFGSCFFHQYHQIGSFCCCCCCCFSFFFPVLKSFPNKNSLFIVRMFWKKIGSFVDSFLCCYYYYYFHFIIIIIIICQDLHRKLQKNFSFFRLKVTICFVNIVHYISSKNSTVFIIIECH